MLHSKDSDKFIADTITGAIQGLIRDAGDYEFQRGVQRGRHDLRQELSGQATELEAKAAKYDALEAQVEALARERDEAKEEADEQMRSNFNDLEELENIFQLSNSGSIGSEVMWAAKQTVKERDDLKRKYDALVTAARTFRNNTCGAIEAADAHLMVEALGVTNLLCIARAAKTLDELLEAK